MKKLIIILILVMGFGGASYASEQKITHVVVVWLNDDLTETQIDDIINQSKFLENLAVVDDMKIGRPIPSERPIVDDSFTFALSVTFKNAADMKLYSVDKSHLEFVNTVLKPVLKKIVIYDF